MTRRLFVVPLVVLLAGSGLLLLALAAVPPTPRALTVAVGRSHAFGHARLWPVSVRLGPAPSAVDVVLSVRLTGGRTAGRRLSVEVCRTAGCTDSEQVWVSEEGGLRGTLAVGRVGSVEPADTLHLGLRMLGGSASPPAVALNASPCTSPLPEDLWRRRLTGLPARPNTLSGIEGCAGRSAPYLPFALELLGAAVAIAAASRGFGP